MHEFISYNYCLESLIIPCLPGMVGGMENRKFLQKNVCIFSCDINSSFLFHYYLIIYISIISLFIHEFISYNYCLESLIIPCLPGMVVWRTGLYVDSMEDRIVRRQYGGQDCTSTVWRTGLYVDSMEDRIVRRQLLVQKPHHQCQHYDLLVQQPHHQCQHYDQQTVKRQRDESHNYVCLD